MNIRKADSKGRLTGFEPGRHYALQHNANGSITLFPAPWSLPQGTVREGSFTASGYEKGYD